MRHKLHIILPVSTATIFLVWMIRKFNIKYSNAMLNIVNSNFYQASFINDDVIIRNYTKEQLSYRNHIGDFIDTYDIQADDIEAFRMIRVILDTKYECFELILEGLTIKHNGRHTRVFEGMTDILDGLYEGFKGKEISDENNN